MIPGECGELGWRNWERSYYYETTVESDIFFVDISSLIYHLIDEWEDAEERNRVNESCEAEEEDLEFWKRLFDLPMFSS